MAAVNHPYSAEFDRISVALDAATTDDVLDVFAACAADLADMRLHALEHVADSANAKQAESRRRNWLMVEFDIAGMVYTKLDGDDAARAVVRSQMVNSQAHMSLRDNPPSKELWVNLVDGRDLFVGLERDYPRS